MQIDADIQLLMDGVHTKRFHIIPAIHAETVGHHTALVCGLLYLLYPDCKRDVLVHAIFHDTAECVTGDIPSTSKRQFLDKELLDSIEDKIMADAGIRIPILDDADKKMVKSCDILAGMITCLHEIKMGNRNMVTPFANFSAYYKEQSVFNIKANKLYDRLRQQVDLLIC